MSKKALKVMVVDNHPLFLKSISSILSGDEYEVRTTNGGLEAIDLLDDFTPNIFFIDLIMPYISGEKLIQYIRSREEYNDIFLVILSGIASETDRMSIPDGADAFIAKGPIKYMAVHIFDAIDQYRNRQAGDSCGLPLGVNEIVPRHITKELLFSLRHLEVLLENMQEGVVELSIDNRIVYINPAAVSILASDENKLLSKEFTTILSDENKSKMDDLLDNFESCIKVKDYLISINNHFVQINILPVVDGDSQSKIILMKDVTSFKEKEDKISKALAEKEMLLKEVHHRVKNNLNIISSLISIQSTMIEDEVFKKQLLEIQPRLHSISLVHDKLYRSEDLTNISLSSYLGELASLLINMFSDENFNINLEIDIPPLVLNTEVIVALGLIVAELVTNAVKFGFEKDSSVNTLKICMVKNEFFELTISNNGKKFPENMDINKSQKLGFQIIELLIDQIGATLKTDFREDTNFTVILPKL